MEHARPLNPQLLRVIVAYAAPPAGIRLHLRAVHARLAHPEQLQLPGRQQHMKKALAARAMVPTSKGADRVVVRMTVGRNEAHPDVSTGRPLDPTGREHPVRMAVDQQRRHHVRAVVALRRRHPFMGARPLRVLLPREGTALSQGAVGRIVRHCLKRRMIRPVAWLRGRAGPGKKRDFSDGHVQRWKVRRQGEEPGRTRPDRPHDRPS